MENKVDFWEANQDGGKLSEKEAIGVEEKLIAHRNEPLTKKKKKNVQLCTFQHLPVQKILSKRLTAMTLRRLCTQRASRPEQ